jgi:glucose/arabinose dehydrogenase
MMSASAPPRLRNIRALALALGALAVVLPAAADRATATTAVPGGSPDRSVSLKAVPVATGLDQPTGFTFTPSGKIWYIDKPTGQVRILNPATGSDHLFVDIAGVDGSGERGGLGIALHPRWPAKPFVYVYVTRHDNGRVRNELIRYRDESGRPAGKRTFFRWSVTSATNHNGGRILFGPDGKLYVVTGENADPSNSQQKKNLRGKILRLNPDGAVPNDNPFHTRIWSFGHRNSFGMAFDPKTGRLWETENGPACNDEINLIKRGGNYAWGPHESCGSLPAPKDTNRDGPRPRILPKTFFRTTLGITGDVFCIRCGLGRALNGDLLFGDVNTARIRAIDLNATRTDFDAKARIVLAPGTVIYSMEASPDGRLYFSGPSGIWRIARA